MEDEGEHFSLELTIICRPLSIQRERARDLHLLSIAIVFEVVDVPENVSLEKVKSEATKKSTAQFQNLSTVDPSTILWTLFISTHPRVGSGRSSLIKEW